MDEEIRERADALFEEALGETGARDPRDYYRDRLRDLKGSNAGAYDEAVSHYEEELLPSIASGEADPVEAWLDFGRLIAGLAAPGKAVEIDPEGRARDAGDALAGRMVLHLPHDTGSRALVVALPRELAPAQKATYDLLVAGRQKLPGA